MSVPLSIPERVVLTSGTGEGSTPLSAFDSALYAAGIHNANIVQVSSIIPPGAELSVEPPRTELTDEIEIGGLHPMVVADARAEAEDGEAGENLVAAVGAGRLDSGYGINVEAQDVGTDAATVEERCQEMLTELAQIRGAELESTSMAVATNRIPESGAAAAIAAAVYL